MLCPIPIKSFLPLKSFFIYFLFLLNFKFSNSLEENFIWTPSQLVEKFKNKDFVDSNNSLDLTNKNEELLQIREQLKNIRKMGFKINLYIINSIPENYLVDISLDKSKNSQAYLKEISQILHEKYNYDKSKSIVAVFALDDKVLDFYKEESFFLFEINDKNKNFVQNNCLRFFESNKEFYKAVLCFLKELNNYYASRIPHFIFFLFGVSILGVIFYKCFSVLKTLYFLNTEKRNNQKANEALDFKFDFSSEKIKDYPISRFSTEYAMQLFGSFNTYIDYFNHNELANINSNCKNSSNFIENNNDIKNNLPLKIFDNNNYNVYEDNETTYSRKIYKIHQLMKNGKYDCHKIMQYICVICLEANKSNKLFESEKNDFLSSSFFYYGSGISSQKINNNNPKFCFLNNGERDNSMCC
jgi:hypothetical protein